MGRTTPSRLSWEWRPKIPLWTVVQGSSQPGGPFGHPLRFVSFCWPFQSASALLPHCPWHAMNVPTWHQMRDLSQLSSRCVRIFILRDFCFLIVVCMCMCAREKGEKRTLGTASGSSRPSERPAGRAPWVCLWGGNPSLSMFSASCLLTAEIARGTGFRP